MEERLAIVEEKVDRLEIVLKKYFNVIPRFLTHTVTHRKNGKTLEIDIINEEQHLCNGPKGRYIRDSEL